MRVAAIVVLGAAICSDAPVALVRAQSTAPLTFEVASVKRTAPRLPIEMSVFPGRFHAGAVPLDMVVRRAYGAPAWRILNAPDWFKQERFDIEATFPSGSSAEQVNAMLRALLEKRFRLSIQTETREMDTDLLVLAKPESGPGPAVQPVRVDCDTHRLLDGSGPGLFSPDARVACGNYVSTVMLRSTGIATGVPRTNKFSAITMEGFANTLAGARGRPVIDGTGLAGQFDIELQYVADSALSAATGNGAGASDAGPSKLTALEEQLGLKLRGPQRSRIDLLVIRSVELPRPEEN